MGLKRDLKSLPLDENKPNILKNLEFQKRTTTTYDDKKLSTENDTKNRPTFACFEPFQGFKFFRPPRNPYTDLVTDG